MMLKNSNTFSHKNKSPPPKAGEILSINQKPHCMRAAGGFPSVQTHGRASVQESFTPGSPPMNRGAL